MIKKKIYANFFTHRIKNRVYLISHSQVIGYRKFKGRTTYIENYSNLLKVQQNHIKRFQKQFKNSKIKPVTNVMQKYWEDVEKYEKNH